jgi:Fe-S cluster biogenesis protein NfuA
VTKAPEADWSVLRTQILQAVMAHFTAGEPVVLDGAGEQADATVGDDDADPAVVAEIRELIETRIRPTAAQGGGDVAYRGYKDGIVLLEFTGPAFGLLSGIENMLKHYVPEVQGAADYRDALSKPGLETPEGVAIQELLDTRINPTVAMHGGHIALVDVQDDTVYIRLEGGCQGCGMADVTLKQGIVVQIQETVPGIAKVLDVTDHASGDNPYYQPGK